MKSADGFEERLSLAEGWAWLDAWTPRPRTDSVSLDQAFGRVLAAPLRFAEDRPTGDIALADGYAVLAESTIGASSYNPLYLTLVARGTPLVRGKACPCNAGELLPPGADAVLPLEAGEVAGAILEVCAPVAVGHGAGLSRETVARGDIAVAAGRRIGAPEIAVAALLRVDQLEVLRRTDVALILPGPKPPAAEALACALSALIARDGGAARIVTRGSGGLVGAIRSVAGADAILVAGRSGWGEDDGAARAIAEAGGRLDHHGLALRPGGSAGFGALGEVPLLLMPGDPLAALVSYELLAGRLIRRLSGRGVALPFPSRKATLRRKIASPIGLSEWVPVTCYGADVEPLPLPQVNGVVGLAQADGFILVPPGLEGYAPGDIIDVYVTSE